MQDIYFKDCHYVRKIVSKITFPSDIALSLQKEAFEIH